MIFGGNRLNREPLDLIVSEASSKTFTVKKGHLRAG